MQEKLREHIEKVIPLTDEEFAFVIVHFSFRKMKKHQFLIQQGDRVNFSYFVVSGLLKLSYTDTNDKEHILHFAMEDWWTTSSAELFTCFDIFQEWITRHGIKQATTLIEVKSLFETLKIELEATVVR